MHCGLRYDGCAGDRGDFVVLPIRQPDGKLNTTACVSCARKTEAFCRTHQRPHTGFDDGSTACHDCIDSRVYQALKEIGPIFHRIVSHLPNREVEALTDWALHISELTGVMPKTVVYRAIVSKALRTKTTPEAVIEEVLATRSVGALLLLGFVPW